MPALAPIGADGFSTGWAPATTSVSRSSFVQAFGWMSPPAAETFGNVPTVAFGLAWGTPTYGYVAAPLAWVLPNRPTAFAAGTLMSSPAIVVRPATLHPRFMIPP